MRTLMLAASILMIAAAPAAAATPDYVTAAVADAGRPQADKDRDVHRKPAEMVVFAGIKPGSLVGELVPGRGYFTRIFTKVVGPTGHVYAVAQSRPAPAGGVVAPSAVAVIASDPGYENLTVIPGPYASWTAPKPLDVVWTSQNYHDMRGVDGAGIAEINKAVFNVLKPGGVYIVLDHVAPAGSTDRSLHRIDPALVKADVLAAGFEFVGESDVLLNSKDNLAVGVMDASVRGDTSQFIYKFRRP